jgi:hypothetical protein
MDGIQQIGLAHTIPSADPDDALVKNKLVLKIILELEDRYGIQAKAQCNFCKAPKIEEKKIGISMHLNKQECCVMPDGNYSHAEVAVPDYPGSVRSKDNSSCRA